MLNFSQKQGNKEKTLPGTGEPVAPPPPRWETLKNGSIKGREVRTGSSKGNDRNKSMGKDMSKCKDEGNG